MTHPILVTGAAGQVGGVGGLVVEALQRRGLPVRAMAKKRDPIRSAIHHPHRWNKAAGSLRRSIQAPRGSVGMENSVLNRQEEGQEREDEG